MARAKAKENVGLRIKVKAGRGDSEEQPQLFLVLEVSEVARKLLNSVAVRSREKEFYIGDKEYHRYLMKSYVYFNTAYQYVFFTKDILDRGRIEIDITGIRDIDDEINNFKYAFSETIKRILIGNREVSLEIELEKDILKKFLNRKR